MEVCSTWPTCPGKLIRSRLGEAGRCACLAPAQNAAGEAPSKGIGLLYWPILKINRSSEKSPKEIQLFPGNLPHKSPISLFRAYIQLFGIVEKLFLLAK